MSSKSRNITINFEERKKILSKDGMNNLCSTLASELTNTLNQLVKEEQWNTDFPLGGLFYDAVAFAYETIKREKVDVALKAYRDTKKKATIKASEKDDDEEEPPKTTKKEQKKKESSSEDEESSSEDE